MTWKLSDIATVVRGVSFDKDDVRDDAAPGFLPILRAGNIEGELLLNSDLVWVPETRLSPEQRMRVHDIAICMSSGSKSVVGKTATLTSPWSGSVGAFCALVRPSPGRVVPEFLSFFLKSEVFRSWTRQSSGANIKNIRKSELEAFPVSLPSEDEQRRIVDLLTRAEGIVRLRREAAAKAAELIPALFIHHFGDPEQAEPQGLATLGSVLSRPIRNGVSPSKAGKYPGKVLTLSAITRGRFDETAVKDSEFASPLADNDLVSSLDMLVCRGNGNKALVGAACFAPRDMPGVAFPDTAIAVRPDQSVVLPSYLETLWATAFIRRQIDAIAKTTNGTYKINQTGLASIRFPVPPLERQQTFGVTLMQLKGLIAQQAAAEAKAQASFDALLAQAFTPT